MARNEFEGRARGLMIGLLLGDALAADNGPDKGRLESTCLGQLACFTLESAIRACVRQDNRGVCDPAAVIWHGWRRWAVIQGIDLPSDPYGTGLWSSLAGRLALPGGDSLPAQRQRTGNGRSTARLPRQAVGGRGDERRSSLPHPGVAAGDHRARGCAPHGDRGRPDDPR